MDLDTEETYNLYNNKAFIFRFLRNFQVLIKCVLPDQNNDNVNFDNVSLVRIDDSADSAKSKIGGRVAVANRICPTVIVSVHPTVWSSTKVLLVCNSTLWDGKKGPAEETSTYVTLI